MKVCAMDYTFHPTLVEPFYRHFMNANFLSEPEADRAEVIAKFQKTLPLYTEQDLRMMLRSSWRPAKVAAW